MARQAKSVGDLIAASRSTGLLVDTNLLLLLTLGGFDKKLIATHKRLSSYSQDDFEKVSNFVAEFKYIWVTPNILTETDNLARQMDSRKIVDFASSMKSLTTRMKEVHIPIGAACEVDAYPLLGLADASTLAIRKPMLILTDDLKLHLEALKTGFDSVNLNHLRHEWQ